jgi:hypothetical protein
MLAIVANLCDIVLFRSSGKKKRSDLDEESDESAYRRSKLMDKLLEELAEQNLLS